MSFYKFEYNEKSTKNSFTSVPQNTINVPRLVQGKPDYWERMTHAKKRRKKTLILADWTAHAWDAVTLAKTQKKLDELLHAGFTLYIWQQGQLKLLTNTNMLLSKDIRDNINPAFQKEILKAGLRQHKLTHDNSLILDDYQIALLLGTEPETPRTYTFYNYYHTPHKEIMTLIRAAHPPVTHLKFRTQADVTHWMQLYGASFSNVTLSIQEDAIIPYITVDTVDDWLDNMASYEELRITPFDDLHGFYRG